MEKKTRNYGIDLLRIVSMLGVITIHILGHGKLLSSFDSNVGYSLAYLLNISVYPAVNCFVIISGFLGYRDEKYYPRLKNLISLFFTVLFYSVVITAAVKIFYPSSVGIKDIIKAFLPVLTGRYWFFTAYFGMFLLSPMLNMFVHKASEKMLVLTFVSILFFGVYEILTGSFGLSNGYSLAWFVCLYTVGASIKKCDVSDKISTKLATLLVVLPLLFTWIIKIGLALFAKGLLHSRAYTLGNILINYCSPTILLMAIGIFCLFSKIGVSKGAKSLISFFASSAFSVYLIHDNELVRNLFIRGRFAFLGEYNFAVALLAALAFVLVIFLTCTLADKLRELLFRLLRLDRLSEGIEKTVKRVFANTMDIIRPKQKINSR